MIEQQTPEEYVAHLLQTFDGYFPIAFGKAGKILRQEKIKQCCLDVIKEMLKVSAHTKETDFLIRSAKAIGNL